jgi:hypothetical protein
MQEIRTASDIYNRLRTLRRELQQLVDEGRLLASTDEPLRGARDSVHLTASAMAGFDQAIEATEWLETMATTDGAYPPLDED